jgi:hypothetical protein
MDSGKIIAFDADFYANEGYYSELSFLVRNLWSYFGAGFINSSC